MNDWQDKYESLLVGLDPAARARVLSSLNNSALEGFEPTEDDVRRMVRLERGEITSLEAMEDVALRRGTRSRESEDR